MLSPDVTPYVDLTVLDLDPVDVFNSAIDYARVALPDWTPTAGSIETVMLEAMAVESTDAIRAINRLPGAITEVMLKLFDIQRDAGSLASAEVIFNVLRSVNDRTIPSGTRMNYLAADGSILSLATVADVTVTAEAATAVATVRATIIGDTFNGLVPGTVMQTTSSIDWIQSVVLRTTVLGGAFAETNTQYFNRAMQRLGRLSSALVLPSHFGLYVTENFPEVLRCLPVNLLDASRTPNQAGCMGLVVSGVDGSSLTQLKKQEIKAALEAASQANLQIALLDPTYARVKVTTYIKLRPGYDGTATGDAVMAALRTYLNPNTWPWAQRVSRNTVKALVNDIPGVARVKSLKFDVSSDIIPGSSPAAFYATIESYPEGGTTIVPYGEEPNRTYDIVIADVAPLVLSDTHLVTVEV
jgi:hypothetical protein